MAILFFFAMLPLLAACSLSRDDSLFKCPTCEGDCRTCGCSRTEDEASGAEAEGLGKKEEKEKEK